MGSGFAKRKKEARAMQESFQEMQKKLKETVVEGVAGSGLVTVTINGDHQMTQIKIKPECVDKEDIEGLEDLIRAAYNQAAKKLEKESTSGMPGLSAGLGGFNPFGM
jgi:DNA-binding YbaB/EbfC family protein